MQITVETINALNRLGHTGERLLEIAEDGRVRPDELEDFTAIKAMLERVAASVSALQLWVDTQIAEGSYPNPPETDK